MDAFTQEKRSEIMRCVHSENTTPEIVVRSLLHRLGFRFRLHNKKLSGTPDIVLQKYKTVIFVHGCFWHRHPNCRRASTPSTREEYWLPKFERTVSRDKNNQKILKKAGWNVVVVWECETRKKSVLMKRLKRRIKKP